MTRFGRSSLIAVLRGLSVTLTAAIIFFGMGSHAQGQSVMTRHVRLEVPSGRAKFLNRLPATRTLRIDIVLPLRDQAGLDELLQEIYDPTSPGYRHFLTVAEFTERFGPTQEDYDAVISYAKSNGFKVVGGSRDGMDVQLEGSVTSIEAAFNVSMGVYQHPTENRPFYAPDREPMLALPFPVWHISGLDNYSIPHPAIVRRSQPLESKATTGSGPSSSFLGSDMRAAYYTSTLPIGATPLTGAGQSVGLLEYYGTDLADVTTYFKNAGQTNRVPITLISTDGTSTSCVYKACDDTEQTLDITQALGMAPGLSALYVFVGSTDTAILSSMTTNNPLSAQLSCSWGWSPADPGVDDPYYKKMAAQGQNFFVAAGDNDEWTKSNYPYPAEDGYVVAVGGTDLTTSSAGGTWASEVAWAPYSGGGISPDHIAIPSWQQLTGVINSSNKASTVYRNGPDVAANANFTFYVCADQTTCTANSYGGTSFAAPMWAGYLALINQQAVANGNAVLGFINPLIYTLGVGSGYSSDFHDITSGSNGFPAVTGYDLVTGWGSPGTGLISALCGISSAPDFTISASPTSLSVVQGGNGTSTISTAVLNGFNSAIGLSASGLPTGVTAAFNPSSITGAGSSILTLTVASTTTTGTYTITVTGTSTSPSITHTATVTLTVTAPASANFTISASPSSITLTRGGSASSTITTTVSGGFASAIALSASGLPSGATVSFTPASIPAPGSGTSTMKVTTTSYTRTGTRTITITGAGGGKTHTTTVTLSVRR